MFAHSWQWDPSPDIVSVLLSRWASLCSQLFTSRTGCSKIACVIVGKEPEHKASGRSTNADNAEAADGAETAEPPPPAVKSFYVPVELLTGDSPVFKAMFESMRKMIKTTFVNEIDTMKE